MQYGTGVAFLGATMIADDKEVLNEVFPGIKEITYPYPSRRIKQLAIAIPKGRQGLGSLVDSERRLITRQLEDLGVALVFCGTKREAQGLYGLVRVKHKTCYLAKENDKEVVLNEHITSLQKFKTAITYTRSVLGKGVNLNDLRFLVIDTHAYRPISSFTPGVLTPEEFELARTRERAALMMQNVGRVLRGEAGKTACIVLLNADDELVHELMNSPAIREGCDLPAEWAHIADDLEQAADQAYRWLDAGGGSWPAPDPSKAKAKKTGGRPKGSSKKSVESVFEEARQAASKGVTAGDFFKTKHPDRHLSKEQLIELREIFK
jgi:hypothetical protein